MPEKLNILNFFFIELNVWAKKTLDPDPESGAGFAFKIKPWIWVRIKAYADPQNFFSCCFLKILKFIRLMMHGFIVSK